MRPTVRRSAAALKMPIARRRTRRVLVAPGVSASRSGIHLRISKTDRELEHGEDHEQRSAARRASARADQPPKNDVVPPLQPVRPPRRPGEHGEQRQQPPSAARRRDKRSLIGVATATISPSLFASAAAIAALTFA